jgi:2Fe-2S ferredoxin
MGRLTFQSFDRSERLEVDFLDGETVLEVAQENNIDMEGTCGGGMACSTCHVILRPKDKDRFPAPSEEEGEMLELALGVTPTSRLGCQLVLGDSTDGLVLGLPAETRSMMD